MAGGSDPLKGKTSAQVIKAVQETREKLVTEHFKAGLAGFLNELLASYNERNVELTHERLGSITGILAKKIDGAFEQLFGGSVAKKTYVDGLSDVDTILVLNETDLASAGPQVALDRLIAALSGRIPDVELMKRGAMAVTITYVDGMEIQILPAIRTAQGLRIPSSREQGWSDIDPAGFQKILTTVNERCGMKLIPTIKLAKAINSNLPEAYRLSGYHAESIGVSIFRDYEGPRNVPDMLSTYFARAPSVVLTPIVDKTGQSVHVDEYLGPPGSDRRLSASHVLERVGKRMHNASVSQSLAQWKLLFGYEN